MVTSRAARHGRKRYSGRSEVASVAWPATGTQTEMDGGASLSPTTCCSAAVSVSTQPRFMWKPAPKVTRS
ncbi:hypothetical protein LRS10_01865 [Phenylobacterium sp. J426]|uniref:hypothetical protein n=1 Tax=Phenylobacterium sp. J426 TaxID=2898439 RepID=UPI002151A094|nr:hypothetical protein [Phenylobacterium sp. J426]MCR5873050.1 hypothetical protein [Phenylobacterium sp. J426]